MDTISIDDFKSAITKHRSVCVVYDMTGGQTATCRFDMDQTGFIREVMTYKKLLYSICHIDNLEKETVLFSLEHAIKVYPTPQKDIEVFDCTDVGDFGNW